MTIDPQATAYDSAYGAETTQVVVRRHMQYIGQARDSSGDHITLGWVILATM